MRKKTPVCVLALLIAASSAPTLHVSASSSTVVISEFRVRGPNGGSDEFIELSNVSSAPVPIGGWKVNGSNNAGTTSTRATIPAGVVLGAGCHYLLTNSSTSGGPYSGSLPGDQTYSTGITDDGGVALLTGGNAIVDQVGLSAGSAYKEGTPLASLGTTNQNRSYQRLDDANGAPIDTDNNSADFRLVSPSDPQNFASVCGAVVVPPPPLVKIHDIQGNGDTSPLVGQTVSTQGVVTAIRFNNGFFIQAVDGDVDGDPATSEGVFVFTGSAAPAAAAVGNLVEVSGTVQEFVPLSDPNSPPSTELTNAVVRVLSTGNPLPPAVTLTAAELNPAGAFDQLERFEHMRVHVDSLTVVAPTQGGISEANATSVSNGVFFGVLPGIARPFREPGIEVPDPLPPGSPCCVPRFDANPERLRVDSDGQVGATRLDVTTGATVTNLTGVLDFSVRAYTVLPDSATPPTSTGNISAIPVSAPTSTQFTIASANLERFFDTTKDPAKQDVALTDTAFANRLNKASLMIHDVMRCPDIIGVEEVENLTTLQTLAAKINADPAGACAWTPSYSAFLEEGNDIGGIDVGFLVNMNRVMTINVIQAGRDATYTNPITGQAELLNDRPSLIMRADVDAHDPQLSTAHVTVIVNHLRSLSGVDDPVDGVRVRAKRRAQAEFLAKLIKDRQNADPSELIVSVGDYNAYEFNDGYVDVIGTIKGQPTPSDQVVLASPDLFDPDLIDLLDFGDPRERYSYVFDGSAQELDHVLISANVVPTSPRLQWGRTNADFPEAFRNDPNRPERISDHDPIVAYFELPRATATTLTVAPNPAVLNQLVTFTATVVSEGHPVDIGAVTFRDATGNLAVDVPVVHGQASVVLTPAVGDHVVTAEYGGTPQFGPSTSGPSTVHIEPGPTIEQLRATPDVLWPPSHKMATVTVAATVIDVGDPVPACGIRSITSSEPDNGLGDGDTAADVSFSGGLVASLRAERAGNGPGRAYTLVVRCTDVFGNHTDGTVVVKVLHSR